MRKLFLLSVCIAVFISTSFSQINYAGEKGVSSVGITAGYAVDNNAFAAGFDFRYNILDHVRLAPSVMYILGSDSLNYSSKWYVNVDAHYLLRVTNTTTVYPIAGIGLSVWQLKSQIIYRPNEETEESGEEGEDSENGEFVGGESTTSKIRTGLNIGVGVEKRLTRDIILGAEFKYNLTTERFFNQAMLLGRVAYYF
ncbi:MAG: outer membrane beta-barrel protein [Tannerella sp.]|jgi:opacity protein-like surface antigen|nr:outer membrane beta-barrel protein [Tannerella sp.]